MHSAARIYSTACAADLELVSGVLETSRGLEWYAKVLPRQCQYLEVKVRRGATVLRMIWPIRDDVGENARNHEGR